LAAAEPAIAPKAKPPTTPAAIAPPFLAEAGALVPSSEAPMTRAAVPAVKVLFTFISLSCKRRNLDNDSNVIWFRATQNNFTAGWMSCPPCYPINSNDPHLPSVGVA
jgi:hypothetical protein